MDPDQFAAIIAGLESQGISRSDIAKGAGISRATVWRLAVGDARLPSYQTITRLKNFERQSCAVSDMKQR